MNVSDFMKLDVATKDKKYTSQVRDHTAFVYGKACMSQRDCDTIKAHEADECLGDYTNKVPCYCTTDRCTGSGSGLSIILPIPAMSRSTLLVLATLIPLASSLQCLHNSTVTNAIYSNGMLVRAYASNYNLGVLECTSKLTRCVTFKAMDISFFNSLDVAQDKSIFVNLIKGNNGKVAGRSCMSQADTDKIKAEQAEDCKGRPSVNDCFCTTDECTGSSSIILCLMPMI
ncbi:hypothetical protein PMAYCL1PPCAC_04658, partial [Pristionchus mayeri]